jgi:hypothetical protein
MAKGKSKEQMKKKVPTKVVIFIVYEHRYINIHLHIHIFIHKYINKYIYKIKGPAIKEEFQVKSRSKRLLVQSDEEEDTNKQKQPTKKVT